MTECKDQKVGELNASATAKSGFKKAFKKAFRKINKQGGTSCIGGQCGTGGVCSFRLTSLTVEYATVWEGDTLVYEVGMGGTGECGCE